MSKLSKLGKFILVFIPIIITCMLWGAMFLAFEARHMVLAESPDPVVVDGFIPSDGIIMDHKRVEPGTFKLHVPIEEWRELHELREHPDKPVVRVGTDWIEYWLPRKDSTFYYAIQKFSPPAQWEDQYAVLDQIELGTGGKISMIPSQPVGWLFPAFASGCMLIGAFIIFAKYCKLLALFSRSD
ncbi:MAG: hypothetical protein Q8Q03_00635 [bacterium]|nr:hypothetical protein [bacterium]